MNSIAEKKKRIIIIVVALVLLAVFLACIVGSVLIDGKRGEATKGVIGRDENGNYTDVITNNPYQYDVEVYTNFALNFEVYLNALCGEKVLLMLNQMFGTNYARQISDNIVECLRKARISPQKAENVGLYFARCGENIDKKLDDMINLTDKSNEGIFGGIFFVYLLLYNDALNDYMLANNFSIFDELSEFSKGTTLNIEETARFLYRLAIGSTDEETESLVKELGETRFTTLFTMASVCIEEVGLIAKGSSLSDLHVTQELIYQTGVEYKNIIEDFGIDNIKKLFGSSLFTLEDLPNLGTEQTTDTQKYATAVQNSVNGINTIIDWLFAFTAGFAVAIPQNTANSLNNYLNNYTIEAETEYYIMLSKAVGDGIEYANNVTSHTTDDIIDVLAGVVVWTDIAGLIVDMDETTFNSTNFDDIFNTSIQTEKSKLNITFDAISALSIIDTSNTSVFSDKNVIDNVNIIKQYSPNIQKGANIMLSMVAMNFIYGNFLYNFVSE